MKRNICSFCKRKAKRYGVFYLRGGGRVGSRGFLLAVCTMHMNKIRDYRIVNMSKIKKTKHEVKPIYQGF